jgi:hypothetical protein
MKRIAALALATLLGSGMLAADSFSLSLFHSATDNLFQTRSASADGLTSFSLSWDKTISPVTFFADVDASLLRENSDLNSVMGSAGVDVLRPFGEKTALYLSLEGRGAAFRSEFSDFNRAGALLTAAVKSYLRPSSILKAEAMFEYRSFGWDIFDFASVSARASIDKYFSSRTTLKTELGWGYKYFLHPVEATAAESQPATGGMAGQGRGYGNRSGRESTAAPSAASGGRGIQIASLSGLVAQGIGDRVGLRLTGFRQWGLAGENPFTSVDEFYMIENPTYDLFSWTGTVLNGQATVLGPWETELKIGYTVSDKIFPGIESLGLDGAGLGTIRRDERTLWDLRLEKDFSRFSVFLAASFIRNASNDPLFDWRGSFVSGGLTWNLHTGRKP